MGCLDENVLSEHLARRLGAAETAAVVEHLDECAECSDLLVDLARAQAPMRALAPSFVAPETQHTQHPTATIADGAPRARPLDPDAEHAPAKNIGRYVVLAQVGSGGMGVVFAAYDPKLERKVAIKLLRSRAGADEVSQGAQRRLMSEARTMARLSHPNVLVVHDVGSHDGHVFLVADFVDGGTLKQWLSRQTRAPGEVMAAMVQAGRGLAAAHKAGLVHRDFKPDNVLVSQEGRVFVADFGLTSAAPAPGSLKGPAGVTAGTPAYMAPEVQLGAIGDERSDQYSFCLTLHQALFGERPLAGASPDSLPSLSSNSDSPVPEPVRAAMRRGLAFEASQRFATMDELLTQLAPFAVVDEVLLRPSRPTPLPISLPSGPPPSRTRLIAAGAVALSMVAVVIFTVVGIGGGRSSEANVPAALVPVSPAPSPSSSPSALAVAPIDPVVAPPTPPEAVAAPPVAPSPVAPVRKRSRAQASAASDPMGRHY